MQTWQTHAISNQFDELRDYDLLACDPALQQQLQIAGSQAWLPGLLSYAQELGRASTWELAARANRQTPQLDRCDARGRPLDLVTFDSSWHQLLALHRAQGLVSLPFDNQASGRWGAWAAGFYLHSQVEQGTMCPATMTSAAIPLLQREASLWQQIQTGLYSRHHDSRDLPISDKSALWLGMGVTEKQGGSDVRANTTQATPLARSASGSGSQEYQLRGHKWFFSAPMCDAHLVTARTEGGYGCFWVPRWRPDGSRNAVRLQRLKDKLGNRSNASAEVEFQDAWGLLIGTERRGIATIIEMAGQTRLNCVLGSAGMLRTACVQAIAYARQRQAFGRSLAGHSMMQSVLADLALESEAALTLGMRLALAFEGDAAGLPLERAWKRLLTPAAKFWVCKRAIACCAEAMEVLGGNGYTDDSVLPRLLREAPVNSIWEGSGNVMCLDVLRAMAREPDATALLLADLQTMAADEPRLRQAVQALIDSLKRPPEALEAQGRWLVQQWVLVAQACLLHRQSQDLGGQAVADAFISSRLTHLGGVVGAIDPSRLDLTAVLQRALPP